MFLNPVSAFLAFIILGLLNPVDLFWLLEILFFTWIQEDGSLGSTRLTSFSDSFTVTSSIQWPLHGKASQDSVLNLFSFTHSHLLGDLLGLMISYLYTMNLKSQFGVWPIPQTCIFDLWLSNVYLKFHFSKSETLISCLPLVFPTLINGNSVLVDKAKYLGSPSQFFSSSHIFSPTLIQFISKS